MAVAERRQIGERDSEDRKGGEDPAVRAILAHARPDMALAEQRRDPQRDHHNGKGDERRMREEARGAAFPDDRKSKKKREADSREQGETERGHAGMLSLRAVSRKARNDRRAA